MFECSLQGHTQPISCMAATEDRSVIITGDQGAESMLVVWNSATALPLQTLQQPHPHGVLAMDISPDGEWLATVSAPDPASGEQEVCQTQECISTCKHNLAASLPLQHGKLRA